jgi:ACS family hexuronate transporter-like MFS transporter
VKIPHIRWVIAALLFTATVINYVDRQSLSVLAPVLTRQLQLSPVQYAAILQGFLIAYTVMYLVSGILVDRWGTRFAMAAFMAWWSIANMLHAFATSAFSLGAFRVLLGIGEPGAFMAATRVASEWYPPKERAFLNGLSNAGAAVGAIIAAPLVVALYSFFGWRSAFVITGAIGLLWLAVWLWLYRLPERPIFEEETPPISWLGLLRLPQTWGLFWSRFLSDPVWWFYLFWLPKYLVEQRGFTMAQIGLLSWLPYLSADFGSVFGGLFSGWLVKRGWSPLQARTAGMWPFAMLMPLSLVIPYTPSAGAALAVISVVTFAHMAWKTNQNTVTNDIYPVKVVGSVSGIAAFGNGMGGAAFTWLTGQVVQHFSYNAIFIIMGFLHPAAFLVFRLLVRKPLTNVKTC